MANKERQLELEVDDLENVDDANTPRHRQQRVAPEERDDWKEWVGERRQRGRKERRDDGRRHRDRWDAEGGV